MIKGIRYGPNYSDQLQLAALKYGMPQRNIIKNPVGLADIVTGCMEAGGTCQTVGAIIDKIGALAV